MPHPDTEQPRQTAPNEPVDTRRNRADGDLTRQRILEAAGQLFAERGYHSTTSKAVCERAQTNLAAINYHFGSRDGLYQAVVSTALNHLVGLDYLRQLASSDASAQEKLSLLIDGLVFSVIEERSWHPRIWAREILSPSPQHALILRNETLPRAEIVLPILAELTGLPADAPALSSGLLAMIAPCMLLMLAEPTVETPIQPLFQRPAHEVAAELRRFVFAGLAAFSPLPR